MDSATEFLFGSCVHSLHETLPYPYFATTEATDAPQTIADRFSDAFRDAQWTVSFRARLGWLWPWEELFKSKTEEPMKVVDAVLKPIIDEAVKKKSATEMTESTEDDTGDETLLDSLVRSTSGGYLGVFQRNIALHVSLYRSCHVT